MWRAELRALCARHSDHHVSLPSRCPTSPGSTEALYIFLFSQCFPLVELSADRHLSPTSPIAVRDAYLPHAGPEDFRSQAYLPSAGMVLKQTESRPEDYSRMAGRRGVGCMACLAAALLFTCTGAYCMPETPPCLDQVCLADSSCYVAHSL